MLALKPESAFGRIAQLVEVQGEKSHAEAIEQDEQILGSEGHGSRYKTLLTNVTEAQGCVVKSFPGGCGQPSFYDLPFGATKTDLEELFAYRRPITRAASEQNADELTESELSTVLFEHPGI